MIVDKAYTAKCAGCKKKIDLYSYKALTGGIYGSHYCKKQADIPDKDDLFTDLKEKKK